MAKKQRTVVVRVKLTEKAYKYFEDQAFRNVREPWQELAYRLEAQVGVDKPVGLTRYEAVPSRFDDPCVVPVEDVPPPPEGLSPLPAAGWTQEQEKEIESLGAERGLSEAQIMMHKLMNKTFEATASAIKAEAVPA